MKYLLLLNLLFLLFSCTTNTEDIHIKQEYNIKDSIIIPKIITLNTNDTLDLLKDTLGSTIDNLYKVYGRIKLICDGMGKPYDNGEQIKIAKRRDKLENKYAKYKIEFYNKDKIIETVYTDKTKRFKYEVNLPDSMYYSIHLYLKSKNNKEYERIKIDRNDDVNTNKILTKRHIWVNYGGC